MTDAELLAESKRRCGSNTCTECMRDIPHMIDVPMYRLTERIEALEGAVMNIADGLYFSPDGGRFEALGGRLFWEDGTIMSLDPGSVIRCLPSDHGQRFSQWSDEQRAEAKKKADEERERFEGQRRERALERRKLLDSVRAKVTPEEYAALGLEDD